MKTLDMINFSDIQPGELIKVLVNIEDDIEDEMYATVKENNKDYLVVSYFAETSLVYKNTNLYELEDKEELVQEENLSEHYKSMNIFKRVKDNLYAVIEDIDSGEDSEIFDESEDEGSDLNDFIVPDNEIDGMVIPPSNHASIDKEWNDWQPKSPGSMKFKQIVDDIETRAKYQADEANLSAK
jgi:hypothetical protein